MAEQKPPNAYISAQESSRWHHGDSQRLSAANKGKPLAERLWSRVERGGGCWIWPGAVTADGYGLIKDGKRTVLVHHASYRQHRGPIPVGHEIDHLCNTRRCVRPDHIEAVPHSENMRRLVERRRAHRAAEAQWAELVRDGMEAP